MANTKQSNAVAAANTALGIAQQLSNIRFAINALLTQNTNDAYSTTWSNFATTAVNADGSLGTADGSPNTAHAIDTRVITGLNNTVSETVLANLLLTFTQLQNFFGDSAVSTNTYGQFLDQAVN